MLLFFVATASMGFIGYEYGLKGRKRHVSTSLFAVIIAVVLTIILDIDRPRRGLIQISDDSLIRLQQVIGQDALLSAPEMEEKSEVSEPQAEEAKAEAEPVEKPQVVTQK